PGGPPVLPYDVAGWTLPMQMGVEVAAVLQPVGADQRSSLRQIEHATVPPGSVQGTGPIYTISHRPNVAFKAINEVLSAGGQVSFARSQAQTPEGQEVGAVVISAIERDRLNEIVRKQSLQALAVTRAPEGAVSTRKPRVGLYRAWVPVIDEGWTRWILEN